MILRIPKPISGGLILSYKCNAECLHCMYACSPKWNADWMSEENLGKILSQLAGMIEPAPYGPESIGLNHGLHFTGGEPFLNFELLFKATEMAHELGIPSLFVETNCYWSTNDKGTRNKMRLLKESGMRGILISVNPFYLEFVPFERTERAIRIGLEIFGQNVAVYQPEYYRRFKEWGIQERLNIDDYLKLERKEEFMRNVEFFMNGRAAYALEERLQGAYPKYPAAAFFNEPCVPSFARQWHNHFDNYGNYIPGYCGGISYGDCRDLDSLLREGIQPEKHPVLSFLINEDLQGLFNFSKEYGYKEAHTGYFSKCHLCTDMRKHLVRTGDFQELQPKEFYMHLE